MNSRITSKLAQNRKFKAKQKRENNVMDIKKKEKNEANICVKKIMLGIL